MKSAAQAENFYKDLLHLFTKHNRPFMVGGTQAFTFYTKIDRPTKDADIFCTKDECSSLLQLAHASGYQTELLDKRWIAKVHKDNFTVDIIFAEGNGLYPVSKSWLERSPQGTVYDNEVHFMPVEEMIRSKMYVQERERFDGADVVTLILKCSETLDWNYLFTSIENDWELFYSFVLLFGFVFPSDISKIPTWVYSRLETKLRKTLNSPSLKKKITRGLTLSSAYKFAIERDGYATEVNESG